MKVYGTVMLVVSLLFVGCSESAREYIASQHPEKKSSALTIKTTEVIQEHTEEMKDEIKDVENDSNGPNEKEDNKSLIIKDESRKNPTLHAFIENLKATVKDQDKDSLLSLLDDDIKVSFGGQSGKEYFVKYWDLDKNVRDSEIWRVIEDTLSLGGSFYNETTYYAPYIFLHFPEELDPFEYAAIVGENVNVRAEPSLQGEILTSLSYDYVKQVRPLLDQPKVEVDDYKYPWVEVITLSGEKGYIAGKYVRSPIDYRIGFSKSADENWKIVFLIAGD